MWGWLTALIRGLADSLLGWYSAYSQGRNAEQAKSSQAAARQSAEIAEAQSAVKPIVIDDTWLLNSSPVQQAPTVTST